MSSPSPAIPKPLPQPTPTTQPFWDAAAQRKLILPVNAAGEVYWYPRALDPGTLTQPSGWREASGKGTVYAFTVDRRGTAPAFAADAPYVIAIIELDEGPHFTTNIVGCDIEDVQVGLRVEATYEDVGEGVTLVKFKPAA
jgi:uncharacterized OB-fold protein